MAVAPRGKGNTFAGFVGPYLFLRAAKDLPPGTTLTFDGFTGTEILPVYPPRGGEDGSRKRKVGIMKNPMGGVVGGFGSVKEEGAGAERQQPMESREGEEEQPMRDANGNGHVLETEAGAGAAPQAVLEPQPSNRTLEESLLAELGLDKMGEAGGA